MGASTSDCEHVERLLLSECGPTVGFGLQPILINLTSLDKGLIVPRAPHWACR